MLRSSKTIIYASIAHVVKKVLMTKTVLWNRNDFCGSVSDFRNVSVPVQVPVPVPDPDNISTVFQQQKFVQNRCLSTLGAALFPESWPLIFDFFYFCRVFHFLLDPDSNPVPKSEHRNALRHGFRSGKKLRFLRFRFRFRDNTAK